MSRSFGVVEILKGWGRADRRERSDRSNDEPAWKLKFVAYMYARTSYDGIDTSPLSTWSTYTHVLRLVCVLVLSAFEF